MKRLLMKFISFYKRYVFSRNAILTESTVIGATAKIGCANKTDITIGKFSSIHGVLISSPTGSIKIGNNTTIRYKTEVESNASVVIGDNVVISNNVIISDNNSHSTDADVRKNMTLHPDDKDLWSWAWSNSKGIIIENNVWIGRRAMILKGVRVGENSIISAGAVVTKDVPKNSLCYGNPAVILEGHYA